jgi:predicted CXXCH cytochrome family protein
MPRPDGDDQVEQRSHYPLVETSVAVIRGGHRVTPTGNNERYMKRINGPLAPRLPTVGSRRLAAVALVAAPLLAGAWLFAAALPALADGGPHVAAANSGVSTLTTDSCAGCHRAHTAQGEMLINAPNEEALCLTCHGAAGTGATTDVMTGVQYRPATGASVRGAILGALRSGGFDQARIASGTPSRVFKTGSAINSWGKVAVLAASPGVVGAGQDVTSAHLNLPQNGLVAPTVAWGNDGLNTGAGPTVSMTCASCHNPHGNGQYRILNPVPDPDTSTGTFVPVAAPGVTVTDAALPAAGDARNYTVIQVKGPSFLLYASQVANGGYLATSGDYWHVRVPWIDGTGANSDAPNGIPIGLPGAAFNEQIAAWCTACHSRYFSTSADLELPDSIYRFRHQTTSPATCTTCHVAHGSNARMEGTFSKAQPFPDGASVVYPAIGAAETGDSRLLKVDNRGTCQMCHDPTGNAVNNQYTGPLPTPGVP